MPSHNVIETLRYTHPKDVNESQVISAAWSPNPDAMTYLIYVPVHCGQFRRDLIGITNLPRLIEGKMTSYDDVVVQARRYGYLLNDEVVRLGDDYLQPLTNGYFDVQTGLASGKAYEVESGPEKVHPQGLFFTVTRQHPDKVPSDSTIERQIMLG